MYYVVQYLYTVLFAFSLIVQSQILFSKVTQDALFFSSPQCGYIINFNTFSLFFYCLYSTLGPPHPDFICLFIGCMKHYNVSNTVRGLQKDELKKQPFLILDAPFLFPHFYTPFPLCFLQVMNLTSFIFLVIFCKIEYRYWYWYIFLNFLISHTKDSILEIFFHTLCFLLNMSWK